MCIRDRCYDIEGEVDGRAIPLGKADVKRRGRDAVSYTHLDVYKRQAFDCALG